MQSRNDPKNPPNSATTTTTTTSTATTSTTTSTSTSTLSEESLNNILHLALQLYHGKKCLFVTGAGLSVSSGIPTYRGDSNSIWSNHITEMGTRRMFQSNPLDWYNNFWLQTHHRREYLIAKPNEGHYSIARLSKLCNVRVITQNIDHLHLKTSLSPSRVIEVHGRLGLYKCVNQRKKNPCPYSKTLSIDNIEIMDYMSTNTFKKTNSSKKPSFKNESVSSLSTTTIQSSSSTFTIESVPTCPSCCKPILPQALLFDEKYESHDFYQWQKAMEWIGDCDLIVFVGTSFSVGVTAECLSIVQEQNEEYLNEIQEEDNTIEELLSNQDEMNSMTSQNDERNNWNSNKNNNRIFNNKNNNKNNNRNNINKNNNRNNINNKNNSSNKNGPIINTKRKLMYNFNMRLDEEVKDLDAMYHVIGRSEFTLPLLYEKLVEIGQVNRWITTSIIHNTDPHVGWMKQQQDDESIIMNDCATFDESSLSTTTTTTVMTTHLVATNIMDTFTTLNHSNPIITNSNPIITNVNTCMNSNSHPNKVMTRTNSRLRMYYYSSQHLSERSNLSLVVNSTSVKTIKRSTNTTTTNTNSTCHVHDSSLPPLRTSTTKTTTTKRTFQIKKHLNSPQPHSADTMHGASHHPLPALKKVKTNPSEENKDHGQEEISTI
ncbi:hypothetical protein C9374_001985 [Naegleria lovaniensis]|uniref:Deacetylase sirtuin-type domain-containing protein n=1 Tax=Naegleria lovaniensis TaxID=51637 RepID=A0AA88KKM0_NAELO|nr:uncharacterized protein C9374_001985 [Naegleria lovaniensis]KAG2386950.1 hypothetical protein C9374_001985 [Naegleria lovaniensis]